MMKKSWLKSKAILILTLVLFVGVILALALPLVPKVLADHLTNNQSTFNVQFTSQNTRCTYSTIASASGTPTDDGVTVVIIHYNVTDPNGYGDIATSSLGVNLTNGSTVRSAIAANCSDDGSTGNIKATKCDVALYYYDDPGAWDIKIYAQDGEGSCTSGSDTSASGFTYNTLYAMRLDKYQMLFNGQPGTTVVSSTNPLGIRNTGNANYNRLDITGKNLTGVTHTGSIIAPTNFVMYTGAASTNRTLSTSAVPVPNTAGTGNVTLAHANSARVDVNMTLNVPTGLWPETYNSSSDWVVDAVG
jgi:hypothetical protein